MATSHSPCKSPRRISAKLPKLRYVYGRPSICQQAPRHISCCPERTTEARAFEKIRSIISRSKPLSLGSSEEIQLGGQPPGGHTPPGSPAGTGEV